MCNASSRLVLLVVVSVTLVAPAAIARDDVRAERVQFERGASSAVVKGSIKGYETVDYVLGARKGQTLDVSMATDNGANYFNLLAPGEDAVAIFNGSMNENQYEGVLSESGDYKIRVYMMRSAARRNEVANYRLEMTIAVSGRDAPEAGGVSREDVRVEGTDYHATGRIPCSMGGGQPTGSCAFGVTRGGAGTATVNVTKPGGHGRAIFFENGKATGYDASQADSGAFSASREGDLNIVRIGDERYEIPDAVVSGG